ncbi:MAG: hypothetical protein JXA30_08985 [Deltaproteobacteria bacterium]|nr:hypothetical protein [Deltaproteobacteria bacterium]
MKRSIFYWTGVAAFGGFFVSLSSVAHAGYPASFKLIDEQCTVMSPDIDEKHRRIQTFSGTKSISNCSITGKKVICYSLPDEPSITFRGNKSTVTTILEILGADTSFLIANKDDIYLVVSWKDRSFHWAETIISEKGVFQKQCAGSVVLGKQQ